MTSPTAVTIPSGRYGSYVLRNRLGAGGQAEVFLAETVDEKGDVMNVAVKLGRPGLPDDTFAGEADLMNLLSHPNLVRLLEVGKFYDRPFIAMEFFIGGDLAGVMEAHRREMRGVPVNMAMHVTIEVLKALAYFHTAKTRTGTPLQLVHSDVNPSNIFFGVGGEVKLGDYGVASSTHAVLRRKEGVAAGKLSYLSPEQTRGEQVTSASDVWAVGVILHELVVGFHPFREVGESEEATLNRIRAAKLSIPDYVDKPLAQMVSKALAADVRNRYRSAGELAGEMFGYALDRNLIPTRAEVQDWLLRAVGVVS